MTLIHDTWAPATDALGLDLYYSGAWHDISDDLSDDGISITRGRANEGQRVDPTEMTCSLYNGDGKYSPRNPNSSLYGLIGRNTPIRAWVETGQPRAVVPGGSQWYCADSAAISVTGDLDIRVDCALAQSWRPTDSTYLFLKGGSYGIAVIADGYLYFDWYASTVYKSATSTVPLPGSTTGRKAIRATIDVDNGASGNTVTFYYSDSITGTWVQLGDSVVTAGTTSIDDTTDTLGCYCVSDIEYYAAQVRNGIGGTIVAYPIFTGQTSGATSFSDGYSNTWTAYASATLTNRHYRFWGEVTEWPQKWGLKGSPQARANIVCSGVLRRIQQGASPTPSALYRGITSLGDHLKGYWPLEDAAGATRAQGVGVGNGYIIGSPTLASYEGFECSAPLPKIGSSRFVLYVPAYTDTQEWQVRFLIVLPAAGSIPDNTTLVRVWTNSTMAWADLVYDSASGGGLYIQPYTNLGVATTATATLGVHGSDGSTGLDEIPMRVEMRFADDGGTGIDFYVTQLDPNATAAWIQSANIASATLGTVTKVEINPYRVDLGDLVVGHVSVEDQSTTMYDLASELRAYAGEASDSRVDRLATENALALYLIGEGGSGKYMGYQGRQDVITLLRECEDTDAGVLFEGRTSADLAYRTGESLYSQSLAPHLSVAYTDNLLNPFEPSDDDQQTRNKVTVERDGGSSATVEDTTSPLSTQDPPDGVGIYDDKVTLSLFNDGQPRQHAGWLVHMGTIDEARWPVIGFDLAHPTFTADDVTTRQILSLDIGDVIEVTDLPSWLPPDEVLAVVQGYSETITPLHYRIEFNCTPARAYRVVHFNDPADRWSNDNTTVNGAHNSTTTSLSVDIPAGPLWTHADGDFDVMVAGERMTVTGVSGSSSPQTFTVTRSVNGVVKAQADGAAVTLFDPVYYGL